MSKRPTLTSLDGRVVRLEADVTEVRTETKLLSKEMAAQTGKLDTLLVLSRETIALAKAREDGQTAVTNQQTTKLDTRGKITVALIALAAAAIPFATAWFAGCA